MQSFPDWFVFKGKYTTGGDKRTKQCPRYTQVGNAVAPFVGEPLGMAMHQLLKQLDGQNKLVESVTNEWYRAQACNSEFQHVTSSCSGVGAYKAEKA